jgi:hypothetical protein
VILASFPEANVVLDKPDDMTREQCEPANVLRTVTSDEMPVVISCWKVTQEELEEIQRTGRVWLMVYGVTMPPVVLCGVRPF